MKKLLLYILLAVLPIAYTMAQDIVYLNNGNTLKGIIVSEDSSSITIKSKEGAESLLNRSEIRLLYKSSTSTSLDDSRRPKYPIYDQNDHGWWYGIDILGGATIEKFKTMGYTQLTFEVGYMINEYIKVGIGAGARLYIGNKEIEQRKETWPKSWSVPLFATARGNILSQARRIATPYWEIDLGYNFNDGFFYMPTLGAKIGNMRNNLIIGVCYMGQIMPRSVNNSISNQHTSFIGARIAYEY